RSRLVELLPWNWSATRALEATGYWSTRQLTGQGPDYRPHHSGRLRLRSDCTYQPLTGGSRRMCDLQPRNAASRTSNRRTAEGLAVVGPETEAASQARGPVAYAWTTGLPGEPFVALHGAWRLRPGNGRATPAI